MLMQMMPSLLLALTAEHEGVVIFRTRGNSLKLQPGEVYVGH